MATEFVDTNVLIRYLTNDHPGQSARALEFLREVETGARSITACEGVLVETVQVLSSKALYNYPRQDIKDAVSDLIRLRGLHIPYKQTYLRALELYASANFDFVDALCIAHMERTKIMTVVSFDRGSSRFQGISRREP